MQNIQLYKTSTLALIVFLVAKASGNPSQKPCEAANECNPTSTYDVIIIGAGMAGLSAAVELYTKRQIKNITILEARNRIGGRIKTVRHDGIYEDYGAQWVHGRYGHDLMDFIDKNNLFAPDNETQTFEGPYFRMDGSKVPDAVVNEVAATYYGIDEVLSEIESRQSVGTLTKSYFDAWLKNNSQNSVDKRGVFNAIYNIACTMNADDLENVSTEEAYVYESIPGYQNSLVKNGWLSVIDRLTANVPLNYLVSVNSVVQKINWNVSCEGENGNDTLAAVYLTDGRVLTAKAVISTLPLGVLKADLVEFYPELPAKKQTAIRRLGFGCAHKIFMIFDEPWWTDENLGTVNVIFSDAMNDCIAGTGTSTWYRNMGGYNAVYGNPNALEAWFTGDWGRQVERMSSSDVKNVMDQIMTKAFSKAFPKFKPAREMNRTEWCSDPFSMGTYSFVQMGAKASDFVVLSLPLPTEKPVLFFAGEATHPSQWSTVHGAFATGIRAASQVANNLKSSFL